MRVQAVALEPLDADYLRAARTGRAAPKLVRGFFALPQRIFTLPEGDPQHLAGVAVGEGKHPLEPLHLPRGRDDLLLGRLDPLVDLIGRTLQSGHPCEHAEPP